MARSRRTLAKKEVGDKLPRGTLYNEEPRTGSRLELEEGLSPLLNTMVWSAELLATIGFSSASVPGEWASSIAHTTSDLIGTLR